jgi:molybdenum cofactor biosynthesis enzyme
LKNEFVNIESIVEIKNEKIFEINTLGNIDNPNITIFSMDKVIDMNFNIKDINQILSGNYEDFFQNLLTNE